MTPLHEALSFEDFASLDDLIRRSDKDIRNGFGQTPMHFAVRYPEHLKKLLQRGHDINAADNFGATPLAYAAQARQIETVTILLESGADIHHSLDSTRAYLDWVVGVDGYFNLVLNTIGTLQHIGKISAAELLTERSIYSILQGSITGKQADEVLGNLLRLRPNRDPILRSVGYDNSDRILVHEVSRVEHLGILLEHDYDMMGPTTPSGMDLLGSRCELCRFAESHGVARLVVESPCDNMRWLFRIHRHTVECRC